VTGGAIDPRTDVYSLGVTLYELLTAQSPYGPTAGRVELLQKVSAARVIPPHEASRSIDRELAGVLLKALARDPADRYARPLDLAQDIGRYLAGEPLARRAPTAASFFGNRAARRRFTAAACMLACLAALTVFGVARINRPAGETVLGGSTVIDRPDYDGATSCLTIDVAHPISTAGDINQFTIYATTHYYGTEGQLKLKIFRPVPTPGGPMWHLVGDSPLETVHSWGRRVTWTLPDPIRVQPGDLIAWWYPRGTNPAIAFTGFTGHGKTLNNGDWTNAPDVDYKSDIPDLRTVDDYQGHSWETLDRVYSIEVTETPIRKPSAFAVGR